MEGPAGTTERRNERDRRGAGRSAYCRAGSITGAAIIRQRCPHLRAEPLATRPVGGELSAGDVCERWDRGERNGTGEGRRRGPQCAGDGAYKAQRAPEAGVLDELQIHQIPVLLGGWSPAVRCCCRHASSWRSPRVIDTPEATHILAIASAAESATWAVERSRHESDETDGQDHHGRGRFSGRVHRRRQR